MIFFQFFPNNIRLTVSMDTQDTPWIHPWITDVVQQVFKGIIANTNICKKNILKRKLIHSIEFISLRLSKGFTNLECCWMTTYSTNYRVFVLFKMWVNIRLHIQLLVNAICNQLYYKINTIDSLSSEIRRGTKTRVASHEKSDQGDTMLSTNQFLD